MTYMVIDLETNAKNKVGNNKGSAHCKDNGIVYFGSKRSAIGKVEIEHYINKRSFLRTSGPTTMHYLNVDLLVGHNIKFDLLYLLKGPFFKKDVLPELLIW